MIPGCMRAVRKSIEAAGPTHPAPGPGPTPRPGRPWSSQRHGSWSRTRRGGARGKTGSRARRDWHKSIRTVGIHTRRYGRRGSSVGDTVRRRRPVVTGTPARAVYMACVYGRAASTLRSPRRSGAPKAPQNRTLRSRAHALAAVQSRARPSTARDETPAPCGRRRWSRQDEKCPFRR